MNTRSVLRSSFARLALALGLVTITPGYARAIASILWEVPNIGPNTVTFACDTDTGSHSLITRFTSPDTLIVDAIEAQIDYYSEPSPLPDWWKFDAAHRDGALTVSSSFMPGGYALEDYWQGRATASLNTGQNGFDQGQIRVHVAMAPGSGSRVVPGREYFAFRIDISHIGTTTTAGCGTAVCIILSELHLLGPGVDFVQGGALPRAKWQGSNTVCPFIQPVVTATWSGVKALYLN